MRLIFLVALLSMAVKYTSAQSASSDSAYLCRLFDGMGGSAWLNKAGWKTDAPVKNWYGVTVSKIANRVTGLSLPANNLTGTLPADLVLLDRLEGIDFSKNRIGGSLPSIFKDFPYLLKLDLSGNLFEGKIPVSISAIPQLVSLDISGNRLSFDGMSSLIHAYEKVHYSPQQDISISTEGIKLIASGAGNAATAPNTFYWYKNGILTTVKQGDSTIFMTDSSSYFVRVKNELVPDLTLNSEIKIFDNRWTFVGVDSTTAAASKQNWQINSIAAHTSGLARGVYVAGKLQNRSGQNYIGYWDAVSSTWMEQPAPDAGGKIIKIISTAEMGGNDLYILGHHLDPVTEDSWGMYMAQKNLNSWDFLPYTNFTGPDDDWDPPSGVHIDIAANPAHFIAEGEFKDPVGDLDIMEKTQGPERWMPLFKETPGFNSLNSIDTLGILITEKIATGERWETITQKLAIDFGGDVYAAGLAINRDASVFNKVFVAKWTRGDRKWRLVGNVFTDYGHSFDDNAQLMDVVNNGVLAISVSSVVHEITLGGNFKDASGNIYLARLNTATNTWDQLGTWHNALARPFFPNAAVRSLVNNGTDLYAAGDFTNTKGKTYVAKIDVLENVDSLGGISFKADHINALTYGGRYPDDIYASGLFQDEADRTYFLAHHASVNCVTLELTKSDLLGSVELQAQAFNTGGAAFYIWRINHTTVEGNMTNTLKLAATDLVNNDTIFCTVYGYSDCSILPVSDTFVYKTNVVQPTFYTFSGDGNWSDPANWSGYQSPPSTIPSGTTIVIPANGNKCVLDVSVNFLPGAELVVQAGANLVIQGDLIINH